MNNLYRIILASLLALTISFAARVTAEGTRVGYEYWITNSETDSAGMHAIHFREFVNGSARKPEHQFSFQRWDDPQLGSLNNRLGIDELVRGARDDLEAAARIALKVCNLWAHSAPAEYPLWNALGILDNVSRGEQYWCTYKQLVTLQALASIGLVSRIVPCHWHHSLEFWSNDYGKWIVMDAWTANYYRKDGEPLGALELHRYSRDSGSLEGSGVWEININPNRWKKDRTQDSIPADSPCYRYIRYIARNDFLSASLAPQPAGNNEGYLQGNSQLNDPLQTSLQHLAWWQEGDSPPLVCPAVRYEQDWNFPLNEVEMTLQRPVIREGVLDVGLDTHTPEFDSFVRRTDGGEWQDCGSRILWELKPGENSLELRSRNKWRRLGPVSRAVLEYRPEDLRVEKVNRLEIPDPGFEKTGGEKHTWTGPSAAGWRMVLTDDYQKPKTFGTVNGNAHSGKYGFRMELAKPPIWARLESGAFRVNPASDVTFRVWLRADNDREATVYLKDSSLKGPAAGNSWHRRVKVGREWSQYELKARLTARTTHLMAGVQAMDGTLWIDDFSMVEDKRVELPW